MKGLALRRNAAPRAGFGQYPPGGTPLEAIIHADPSGVLALLREGREHSGRRTMWNGRSGDRAAAQIDIKIFSLDGPIAREHAFNTGASRSADVRSGRCRRRAWGSAGLGIVNMIREGIRMSGDKRCLTFQKNDRPVRTASATQVREPVYKSSVGRWRPYRPFLAPLLQELGVANAID